MQTDRTIYLALAELARRYEAGAVETTDGPLTRYELRCFSQHGEDGVIAELLRRVGTVTRWFVEFGIETGREGNCVFLADVLGWDGLFIEPDPEAWGALQRKYAGTAPVRTVQSAVTPENVEEIFALAGVPAEPDVLSIDVDGRDYWIWSAITNYRPRVLVIEYNAALPVAERLVQRREHTAPWGGTNFFGASLQALVELGEQKGYRFVHTDLSGANAFFVRDDLGRDHPPSGNDAVRRGEPNYFMIGYNHPHDPGTPGYVDPKA